MSVKPIPEGYHTITPFLVVEQAEKVIKFLKDAFGAKESFPAMKTPEGKIAHAELKIGDSMVMIAEACGEKRANPTMLYLYMENVDEVYKKAINAGGQSIKEPVDQFYGDRSGGVKDPSGNEWWIATHKEDVSAEECAKRMQQMQKEKAHV